MGSLGTISNDLQDIPHNHKILVKGAMGCVIGVGLGIALSIKGKVVVIIGDGACLMKVGSLATVNKYKPKNLDIIVLINNKFNSCGGQETNFKYICKSLPAIKIKNI